MLIASLLAIGALALIGFAILLGGPASRGNGGAGYEYDRNNLDC